MHIEHTHLSFELLIKNLDKWDKKAHKHSFFELVYIKEGNGKQCINYNMLDYSKGNIFLLPPLDCHSFEIENPTTFVFLKFTDQLFDQKNTYEINTQNWFEKVSYILRNYNKSAGDVIQHPEDHDKIVQLIEMIILEDQKRDAYAANIIQSMIIGILNILTRHIEQQVYNIFKPNDIKFNNILKFIQNHLFENDKLKVSYLSNQFNISKTYFSAYFKSNFGISLHKYILNSRLKVVETRILYSDLSIKEIAYEVGFTDSSHLSNVFKKEYGISIGQFKSKGEYHLLKEKSCNIFYEEN